MTNVARLKSFTKFKSQLGKRVKGNIVATTVTSMYGPEGVKEPTSDPEKAKKKLDEKKKLCS